MDYYDDDLLANRIGKDQHQWYPFYQTIYARVEESYSSKDVLFSIAFLKKKVSFNDEN